MAQRGPGTARGKAASSLNAIKHGLRSDAPVIPELESFEDCERHRAGTIEGLKPEAYFETDLSGRIERRNGVATKHHAAPLQLRDSDL